MRLACWLLVCLAIAGPSLAAGNVDRSTALTKGSVTGATLPRFASLRMDTVNVRRGPGRRYPIDWVYHRRGLPVEIIREFDIWRQIRTSDGTTGWVHHALLSSRRGFIVTGARASLRRSPRPDARAVAHLEREVVGVLLHCGAGEAWCRVQVHGLEGYLARSAFWGSKSSEALGH